MERIATNLAILKAEIKGFWTFSPEEMVSLLSKRFGLEAESFEVEAALTMIDDFEEVREPEEDFFNGY